jgi:hypothetical protein
VYSFGINESKTEAGSRKREDGSWKKGVGIPIAIGRQLAKVE